MPSVVQLDTGGAAVPDKAIIRAGDIFCPCAIQQAEFSAAAHGGIAVQQRCGTPEKEGAIPRSVGIIHTIVTNRRHFLAHRAQVHPLAVPLCGGKRGIKKVVGKSVVVDVCRTAIAAAVNVLSITDNTDVVVALVFRYASLDRHIAVHPAAVQQHVFVCRRGQFSRAH